MATSRTYMAAYMKKRYHDRRDSAKELLGGKCSQCQTTQSLQFDHIDPSTKSFNVAKLWSCSEQKFNEEIKKCQLLCKSCHIQKTRKERLQSITHGKEWAYRKLKCRCDLCVEWRKEATAKRKTQRHGGVAKW